jgi:hypothetical protein
LNRNKLQTWKEFFGDGFHGIALSTCEGAMPDSDFRGLAEMVLDVNQVNPDER